MKRIFTLFSILAFALTACQQKEVIETPVFEAVDENDDPAVSYTSPLDYTLDLSFFQYSKAANNNDEILKAPVFKVNSNCAWRIEPEDGVDPEWVRPYPEEGKKEGIFSFFLDRNNDSSTGRTAVYKVILYDGTQDVKVGGSIIVFQNPATDFLKVNVASIDANKEGGSKSVTVTSNVDWTYRLEPNEDYASPAVEEWITDNTELKEGSSVQTLKFRFADNSDGSIRGATLYISSESHPELNRQLQITQFGVEVEVVGFPASWPGAAGNSGYPKWASASNGTPTIDAMEGTGTIQFIFQDVPGLDRAASSTDCSGSNPRVNGAWPGDYMLFTVPSAVSAGSLIKLQFETRISGSGIKHWRLEYNDGGVWLPAAPLKTEEIAADDIWPAETISYTHDMSPGGSGDEFNKVISAVVRFQNTMPEAAFRFVAASNVIASTGLRMAKPTTASFRLDKSTAESGCDATISCVASGGEIKYADITVTGLEKDYILFGGTPAAPVKFNVLASDDFTVTSDAPWVSVTAGATGLMDEETEVEVTCEPSTLSEPREASITILAGVTRKVISVIQSAAGQELDPFISISSGNRKQVLSGEGSFTVKIQSNIEVSAEASDAWITVEPAPETKAMVEWTEYVVNYQANDVEAERTGTVRFFNEDKKQEAVLTLVQAAKEPEPEFPEGVYFQDDFEWLEPWSTAVGAPDDVTANSVGSSKNMFTTADIAGALESFQSRGYGYIWGWKGQDWSDGTPDSGDKQTLYLMKNYLKFGKTDFNSGIILPALKSIPGTADVELTFDWSWCMTGKSKPDTMTLTVEVSGGGTIASTGTTVSENIESAQPTEGDLTKLEWQHAKVKILGATPSTRITIRPTNADPSVSNSARRQNRWYLDNIKVAEPVKTTVFQDDFEWLDTWSKAVNAPDDVTANSVGSSKNMFTTADIAGALESFQTRGYGYIWGWKGQDWSDGTPDNGNKQTLYLMKNYLKFGKTSYNSGIILPALSSISGTADVELSFDWCWCMTGASKPDIMTLTVEVSGGGTIASTGTTVSGNIESAQPTEGDLTKLEWQHAKVKILGATPSTRITIRPTNTDPEVTSTRKQNRWYLDNILITE